MSSDESPVSDFLYLQPLEAGEANRILVRRSAFDVPPRASWFYVNYVRLYDQMGPHILAEGRDGIFVCYVPVRHALLLELVQCASNIAYTRACMQRVPKSVVHLVDTCGWASLMDEYAVTLLEAAVLPDGPPTKRRRMLPA